jgi:hypothetical protein
MAAPDPDLDRAKSAPRHPVDETWLARFNRQLEMSAAEHRRHLDASSERLLSSMAGAMQNMDRLKTTVELGCRGLRDELSKIDRSLSGLEAAVSALEQRPARGTGSSAEA